LTFSTIFDDGCYSCYLIAFSEGAHNEREDYVVTMLAEITMIK